MKALTRALLVALSILMCPVLARAQLGNTVIISFPGAPSGACAPINIAVNAATGAFFDCLSGSWNPVSSSGTVIGPGSSTVGDVPLFNNTSGTLLSDSGLQIIGGGTGVLACTPNGLIAGDYFGIVGGVCTELIPGISVNTQSGAGYTLLSSDRTKVVQVSNASAQNLNIPQAGSGGFTNQFYGTLANFALAGTWTIKSTTSTVNGVAGATGVALPEGQWCGLYTPDGSNWVCLGSPGFLTATTSNIFTTESYGTQINVQGTDTNLLSAGTISGTSALLCTDANGGATTTSCAGSATQLVDSSSNPTIKSVATGSAVDFINATNGAAGSPGTVELSSAGSDTNVTFLLQSKGTGLMELEDAGGAGWYVDNSGNWLPTGSGTLNIGASGHAVNTILASTITPGQVNAQASSSNVFFQNAGANGSSSTVTGVVEVLGGPDTGTGATKGGSTLISPGGVTSATGIPGLIWFEERFLATGTVTQYNLECESAAMTVSDCGASSTSVIGIADTTTNPVVVVTQGEMFVNASAAVTLGHTVCTGSTAGKVTDSGGTGACTLGEQVGVVIDISDTFNAPTGSTVTATSTLPLIHIKMD